MKEFKADKSNKTKKDVPQKKKGADDKKKSAPNRKQDAKRDPKKQSARPPVGEKKNKVDEKKREKTEKGSAKKNEVDGKKDDKGVVKSSPEGKDQLPGTKDKKGDEQLAMEISEVRALLASDAPREALERLQALVAKNDELTYLGNDIIMALSAFHSFEQQQADGILSNEDIGLYRNRIRNYVLALAEDVQGDRRAKQASRAALESDSTIYHTVRDMLVAGKTEDAIGILVSYTADIANSDLQNSVILLSSQWHDLKWHNLRGVLNDEEYATSCNRIRLGIFSTVHTMVEGSVGLGDLHALAQEELPDRVVNQLYDLIGRAAISEALSLLEQHVSPGAQGHLYTSLVMVAARHADLERQNMLGIISYEHYTLRQSKVVAALLELVESAQSELGMGESTRELLDNTDLDPVVFYERVEQLLLAGKTEEALRQLVSTTPEFANPELSDQFILLSSSWHTLEEQEIRGVVNEEDLALERNRIRAGLLSALSDIVGGGGGQLEELVREDVTERIIEELKTLIAKDALPKVLEQLERHLAHGELRQAYVVTASRYAELERQGTDGTVSDEHRSIHMNRIRRSLLDIMDQMEVEGGKGAGR